MQGRPRWALYMTELQQCFQAVSCSALWALVREVIKVLIIFEAEQILIRTLVNGISQHFLIH